MAFVLQTVNDYFEDARTLLLDRTPPFRYDNDSCLVALNMSLIRTKDLRPDIMTRGVPAYSAVDGQAVPVPGKFRLAVLYGMVGHALIRDQEDVQDERATMFLNRQEILLTGMVQSNPIHGGTTPPGNAQR